MVLIYELNILVYSETCEILFYEGNLKNDCLDVLMIINIVPSLQDIHHNS